MWQISRRGLLKAMASVGLAAPFGLACHSRDTSVGARPTEAKDLHFNLSGLRPDIEHTLELGARRYKLVPHGEASRVAARRSNALLAYLRDEELTHHVSGVVFPADAPQSYVVTHELSDGRRCISLAGIHVPRKALVDARAIKGASFSFLAFRRAGLRPLDTTSSAVDEIDPTLITDLNDAARWLVYHHPDVLSLDPTVAAILLSHLDGMKRPDGSDPLSRLVAKMKLLGYATSDLDEDGWARAEWTLDPSGNRIPATDENGNQLTDAAGRPLWQFHFEPNPALQSELQAVVIALLNTIRDDEDLEGVRFFTPVTRSTREEPLPDPTPSLPVTREDGPAPEPPIEVSTTSGGVLMNEEGGGYTWAMLREGTAAGQTVTFSPESSTSRRLSVTVENSFNRHLSVFFAFLDAGGNPLAQQRPADKASTWDTEYIVHAGLIDAPPVLVGVPLGIKQRQTYQVEVPPTASRLAVLTGTFAFHEGDYRDEYKGVFTEGMLATLVIEYGIPTIALTYGALFTAGTWSTIAKELALTIAKLALQVSPSIIHSESPDYVKLGIWLGNECLKIALAESATFAAVWAGALTLGQATRGIPIFGTALFALQAVETTVAITRTTVEASMAKRCTEFQIVSTNPVRFVVSAKAYGFPQTGRSYRLQITPVGGDTLAPVTGPFDPIKAPSSFTIDVPAVPSGGSVSYVVEILSASGVVVGRAVGEFLNVIPDGSTRVEVPTRITNSKIVIDETTTYSPFKRLAADGTRHAWVEDTSTPLPGADTTCATDGLCEAIALAVGGEAQLAYVWKERDRNVGLCSRPSDTRGTVLFTMQNVNLNATPDFGAGDPDATLKSLGCGESAPVIPVYRVTGDGETPYARGAVPDSLVLEASSGTYHLRTYRPTPSSDPDYRRGPSWGRLQTTVVRAAALHKSGTLLAISGVADKLELLTLPIRRGPGADAVAPRSVLRSGPGKRVGCISGAVAVCATDDTDSFVVLEDGNKRLQAFGCADGLPDVTFFKVGGESSAILPLDPNRTYLDVAYEPGNKMIFVLSRVTGSARPDDFVLEVYERTRGLVATTRAFVARKIALDDNQNVYALGWDSLLFAGRREPDVWLWIPSVKP